MSLTNKENEKLGIGVTIGTGTSSFQKIAEQIKLAEEYDLEFVELSVYDWNIICGRKIISNELNKLKKICKNSKLNFTVHGELSVNFLDEENIKLHKEVLKRDIEISSAIEAPHLVTHFGVTNNENFKDNSKFNSLLSMQREAYEELGEFAKSNGVILVVENLFNFMGDNIHVPLPSIVYQELIKINHTNVKGTLDFSHAYINSVYYKSSFFDEVEIMSKISKHLHLHDSFGQLNQMFVYNESEELSYGLGDLHLPLGWGNIPFDDLFEKIEFPRGLILILEIQERFIEYFPETILKARNLINKARIINP